MADTLNKLLIVLALITAPLLAGCADTGGDGGDGTDDGDGGDGGAGNVSADAYTLTATGVPSDVTAGEAFNFTLAIEGGDTRTSDHIGAHYGNTSTDAPSTTVYDKACAHTAGDVPGTFNVTCTLDEAGTVYLRGHLRVEENGTQTNFWTEDEFEITVTEDTGDGEDGTPGFTLTATGVPAVVNASDAFRFTLQINGTEEHESDHIGAHYGNTSTDAPSTTVYDKACAHTAGTAPGTFEVTCSFADAGTHYLRGHLRIVVDGEQVNYWTDEEFEITVRPEYTLTATGVPTAAVAGEAFNFTLNVTGDATFESDHIGAHYGNESTDTPTTVVYDKACAHTAGEVPGEFTVTCGINESGTYHLRGHLRIQDGDNTFNYWTADEFLIVVA